MEWFKKNVMQVDPGYTDSGDIEDSEQKTKKSKKIKKIVQKNKPHPHPPLDRIPLISQDERNSDISAESNGGPGRILSKFNPMMMKNRNDKISELTKVVVDENQNDDDDGQDGEQKKDRTMYQSLVEQATKACENKEHGYRILILFDTFELYRSWEGLDTKLEYYYQILLEYGLLTESFADPLVTETVITLDFKPGTAQFPEAVRLLEFNIKDGVGKNGDDIGNVDLWIMSLRIHHIKHTFDPDMQVRASVSSLEESSWLVMKNIENLSLLPISDEGHRDSSSSPPSDPFPHPLDAEIEMDPKGEEDESRGNKSESIELSAVSGNGDDDNHIHHHHDVKNTLQDLFACDVMPYDHEREISFRDKGYIGNITRNPLWSLFVAGKDLGTFKKYGEIKTRSDGNDFALVVRNLETFIILKTIRESPHIATPDPNFKYKIENVINNYAARHFKMEATVWESVLSIVRDNIRPYSFSDLNFVLARFDEEEILLEKDEEIQMVVWIKARVFHPGSDPVNSSSTSTISDPNNTNFVSQNE